MAESKFIFLAVAGSALGPVSCSDSHIAEFTQGDGREKIAINQAQELAMGIARLVVSKTRKESL